MPISKEEFDKAPEHKTGREKHDEYVDKLKKIGRGLGFQVDKAKTAIGLLDCQWTSKINLPKMEEIPIVAFEVVCSEGQKGVRGSICNLRSAKAPLAVICLMKEEIKKNYAEDWLLRLERYIEKMKKEYYGSLRLIVWDENDIDGLYNKIVQK